MFGGLAINLADCSAEHALGHGLGGVYGLPHGLAVGLLLAECLETNRPARVEELERIGEALGEPADDARDGTRGIRAVRRVLAEAGFPVLLRRRRRRRADGRPRRDLARRLLPDDESGGVGCGRGRGRVPARARRHGPVISTMSGVAGTAPLRDRFLAPALMGVVNVTPDSFSDGGRFLDPDAAIEEGLRHAAEGAAVVDVGGESTRPGSEGISRRAGAGARAAGDRGHPRGASDVAISIDTSKAEVADAAIRAGAVDGQRRDRAAAIPEMAALVAAVGVDLCLMHMLGTPRTMQDDPRYDDVVAEVGRLALRPRRAGLRRRRRARADLRRPGHRLRQDTSAHNLSLIAHARRDRRPLRPPVLIGAVAQELPGAHHGRHGSRPHRRHRRGERRGRPARRLHAARARRRRPPRRARRRRRDRSRGERRARGRGRDRRPGGLRPPRRAGRGAGARASASSSTSA